jgi:hypothetical protein
VIIPLAKTLSLKTKPIRHHRTFHHLLPLATPRLAPAASYRSSHPCAPDARRLCSLTPSEMPWREFLAVVDGVVVGLVSLPPSLIAKKEQVQELDLIEANRLIDATSTATTPT